MTEPTLEDRHDVTVLVAEGERAIRRYAHGERDLTDYERLTAGVLFLVQVVTDERQHSPYPDDIELVDITRRAVQLLKRLHRHGQARRS